MERERYERAERDLGNVLLDQYSVYLVTDAVWEEYTAALSEIYIRELANASPLGREGI